MTTKRMCAPAGWLVALIAIFAGAGRAAAQPAGSASPDGVPIRIEVRFIDRASGLEAGWGATGQILIAPAPSDQTLQRWREERAIAVAPARQRVTLDAGGRGLIRVGREIPFAGWFLRHGVSCGWLDAKSEWREVVSTLEVESAAPVADGTIRLAFTPEFTYLDARARRTVSFPGERAEVALTPGVEARFAPGGALAAFYGRLLSGYDPLRRVWPVDLLLRADYADAPEP